MARRPRRAALDSICPWNGQGVTAQWQIGRKAQGPASDDELIGNCRRAFTTRTRSENNEDRDIPRS